MSAISPPSPRDPRPVYTRLYHWVLHGADSPRANWALFFIAFAESSFFPIPPDVLLIALVMGRPAKAFRFASIASLGSVLGGMLGYLIGWGFWEATQGFFFRLPGLTPEAFAAQAARYDQYGLSIVFLAAFTPIPYKLITISAGVFGIAFLPFVLASIVGRAGRFFLVAWLLHRFGPRFAPVIERHFEKFALAFGVLLVGGFIVIKLLAH
jgi:membrane protein YqaA with SNARE-associated domain